MQDHRAAVAAESDVVSQRLQDLTTQREELMAAMESSNLDDEHDPEGTTLAWERENLTALIQQAETRLAALRATLRRLDDGWAGDCADCGRPIPAARLVARPEASRCVPCQSARE